jgi:nicotinamide mononucleotide transporter
MTFVGWWIWYKKPITETTFVKTLSTNARLTWLGIIVVGSFALSYLTTHFSQWWPTFFPVAASYALIDAATTVISFVATYLMAKRFFEAWPLWILVDVVGIWLYYVKDVKFIALEYVLFLVMAIMGAIDWYRNYKRQTV